MIRVHGDAINLKGGYMMANKKNYNKISTEAAENQVKEEVVETPTEQTSPIPVGVVANCKKLNVRKKPDLGAKVIKVLDVNDEVEIIDGADKDFYEVALSKGTKGFCMKKYIKIK
jgi:uncharacterized protein YgiM (DUF1202 family)